MGAIDNFLKRRGYARLDRYGLILTEEGRVLTTRPAVLDDGLGGKIVGWLEGDLAAMELDHWGATKQPAARAPHKNVQRPPVPRPVMAAPVAPPIVAAPAPVVAAPAPAPVVAAPVVAAPAPAPVVIAPAPAVAQDSPAGEDEWEWEIAMARARAAAEEVEQARIDLLGASAVIASPVIPRRKSAAKAEPIDDFPKTQPLIEKVEPWEVETREAPRVMSPLEKSLAIAKSAPQRTVIPVPQLPVAANPNDVRPAPYTPSQPRRFARGTGVRLEDTVQTKPAAPRNDDRTSPYITLPSEVKPVGYAHTKRVAAKQR